MRCFFAFLQRDVKGLETAAAAASESPEATALSTSISQKQQQLDKLEGRLNGIKDRLFADFRWGWAGGLQSRQHVCQVFFVQAMRSQPGCDGCAERLAKSHTM